MDINDGAVLKSSLDGTPILRRGDVCIALNRLLYLTAL